MLREHRWPYAYLRVYRMYVSSEVFSALLKLPCRSQVFEVTACSNVDPEDGSYGFLCRLRLRLDHHRGR